MSKKDKIQAKISWLESIFTLLVGMVFAVIGWLVTTTIIKPTIEILAIILIVADFFGIIILSIIINKKIDELEEL